MPSKILQDIWIMNEGGTVIFDRVFDEKVDPQLFGALMTALNTFAEEISEGGLSNFELSNVRFTILKKESLLFITNSDSKVKSKKVQQELMLVVDKFFKLYPQKIFTEWDGDITIFAKFKNEIEDSLDDPVKKMQKAFW